MKPYILIFAVIALLGFFSKNNTLVFAACFLLAIKIITPLNVGIPLLEKHGLSLGILILTIAIMVPIANEKIAYKELLASFTSLSSFLAIFVGILVAWLGSQGVGLIKAEPQIIISLLIGTIIGIGFFKGVPVGPLIAAGILALFIGKS